MTPELVSEGQCPGSCGVKHFGALAGQAGFGASAVSPGGELWGDARPIDWTAWDPARRRVDPGGPADELVEHLSGAQNVEFRRT